MKTIDRRLIGVMREGSDLFDSNRRVAVVLKAVSTVITLLIRW
jgi:hypothetical protein